MEATRAEMEQAVQEKEAEMQRIAAEQANRDD
jgi:hypothetical protein